MQGHYEVFICNTDELPDGADSVPTQACFNKFPLDRAADNGEFSPIDPNFPGRYFVDPECRKDEIELNRDFLAEAGSRGYTSHMRYVLPDGLECKQCVIQSVYRECRNVKSYRGIHPGYSTWYYVYKILRGVDRGGVSCTIGCKIGTHTVHLALQIY